MRPPSVAFHDDVFKLVNFSETAEGFHTQLPVLSGPGGFLPDLTRGNLHVLLFERIDHVIGRQAVVLKPRGIQPNPHAIIFRGKDEEVSDSLEPQERVFDADVGIIGKIEIVKFLGGRIEAEHAHEAG